MIPQNFTNKSQEAIINAQIVAQEHGQQHIEAMHILYSLLDQEESIVTAILNKLNILHSFLIFYFL